MGKRQTIILDMKPKAKERPRHGKGGHTYTPTKTREAEKEIARLYTEAGGVDHGDGPLELGVTFTKDQIVLTIGDADAPEAKLRGDLDNYIKLVSDALNGVAYTDDKQIKILSGVIL